MLEYWNIETGNWKLGILDAVDLAMEAADCSSPPVFQHSNIPVFQFRT
jgi:hypothetical protein